MMGMETGTTVGTGTAMETTVAAPEAVAMTVTTVAAPEAAARRKPMTIAVALAAAEMMTAAWRRLARE